jgi:hypothetical protein
VLNLNWLFEEQQHKESSDSGSSSTTTLSQQEAARLLPDLFYSPPRTPKGQGAIPKRPTHRHFHHHHHHQRANPHPVAGMEPQPASKTFILSNLPQENWR